MFRATAWTIIRNIKIIKMMVGKWVHQATQKHNTILEFQKKNFHLTPTSFEFHNSHPIKLQLLSSSYTQLLHPPSINASCLPSTHPVSIVCTSLLLSLPWCPALHREEAALPLPFLLVRTIHASSLTPVAFSLSPWSRLHEAARLTGFLKQGLVQWICKKTWVHVSDCLWLIHPSRLQRTENSVGKVCAVCLLLTTTSMKLMKTTQWRCSSYLKHC